MGAAGAQKLCFLLMQKLYFQRKMGKDMGKVSPPPRVGGCLAGQLGIRMYSRILTWNKGYVSGDGTSFF